MYYTLLLLHSAVRWLVLTSLLTALYRAVTGYAGNKPFSTLDDSIRHWTATIAHIQLILGITIYFQSPVVKYAVAESQSALVTDHSFFKYIHISLMLLSVVLITIGSAIAKRKDTDREKFQTMLIWFGLALIIIFMAIPWPFSPLAARPYIRSI